MQTRRHKIPLSSPPLQILKEVHIPLKKRRAETTNPDEAPAPKKQRSNKTVHFESVAPLDNDNPARHSIRTEEYDDPRIDFLDGLRCALEAEDGGFPAELEDGDVPLSKDRERVDRSASERADDVSEMEQNNAKASIPNRTPFSKPHANHSSNSIPSKNPKSLRSDPDRIYTQRYLALKTSAFKWATTYFTPTTTIKPLDLLSFCITSPELMEYANYISACGSSTWEDVFDEQRPFLVYGILGKMLEVHVLGHEMFGGTGEQVEGLRRADEEEGMGDGLLRQKKRSVAISRHLSGTPQDPNSRKTLPSDFLLSLSKLQASFVHMISPLIAETPKPTYTTHLSQILFDAATLSLSIRREPTTIYHWHTHPSVGTLFTPKEMHILDRASARTGSLCRKATDAQTVTMAGWPSLVAYGPHNMNQSNRRDNSVSAWKAQRERSFSRVLARAEVLVSWGQPAGLLAVGSGDWLGPCLRDEMGERVVQRDWEERRAVVGSGLAVGASLAVGWAWQQEWVSGLMRGFVVV